MRIRYRIRQFFHALVAPLVPVNAEDIRQVLSPELAELFFRLAPAERSHSVRVLETLRSQGFTDPDLLAAALLHDVGKSRVSLRLHERVLIVLKEFFFRRGIHRNRRNTNSRLELVYRVAKEHPEWGAEMVLEAGGSERLSWLVRMHQEEHPAAEHPAEEQEPRLLAALQQADRMN